MATAVLYLFYVFLPSGVLLLIWHAVDIAHLVGRGWRRVRPARLVLVPAPVSIERIAADLQRLARLIERYRASGSDTSLVKWKGALRAYEDRLTDACTALDVAHRLPATTGFDHRFELARVELALLDCGLAFVPPGPSGGFGLPQVA